MSLFHSATLKEDPCLVLESSSQMNQTPSVSSDADFFVKI